MKVFDRMVLASTVVVLAQAAAHAHFKLLEPTSYRDSKYQPDSQ